MLHYWGSTHPSAMPTYIPDHDQIGRLAAYQLEKGGVDVSADDAAFGAEYSVDAYHDLFETTKYDPFKLAPGKAKQAAVAYVKAQIQGLDPEQDANYVRHRLAFQKRAAAEHHAYDGEPPLGPPNALRTDDGEYVVVDP